VRHSKRCLKDFKAPPRSKSCRQCSASKVRCDLQRPTCGRCQHRSVACQFIAPEEQPLRSSADAPSQATRSSPASISSSRHGPAGDIGHLATRSPSHGSSCGHVQTDQPQDTPLDLVITEQRRQDLLQGASSAVKPGTATYHAMSFTIHVLRSWPRIMATYDASRLLPPIIHGVQVEDGLPTALANCCTLVKMWNDQLEGSRDLVQSIILQHVRRLLKEASPCYSSVAQLERSLR